MPIELKCPNCQTALQASDDLAGKQGRCPMCKNEVAIPKKTGQGKKDEPHEE